jgi:hypothetical protein
MSKLSLGVAASHFKSRDFWKPLSSLLIISDVFTGTEEHGVAETEWKL